MVRRAIFALALVALALGGGLWSPGPVAAEYCRPVMPDHAHDASGYTFRATIAAVRVKGGAARLTYIAMAVDKVYANRDSIHLRAGSTIEIYSNPCDGFGLLGLAVGDDVVMSTGSLEAVDGPATWNTAVWRVTGNGLHLLVLNVPPFEKAWYTADRRIAHADTLRQVLALVAPGAVGVPNTATDPARNSTVPVWAVIVVGVAAFVLAAIRFGLHSSASAWQDGPS